MFLEIVITENFLPKIAHLTGLILVAELFGSKIRADPVQLAVFEQVCFRPACGSAFLHQKNYCPFRTARCSC